jgi:hypothetical protein
VADHTKIHQVLINLCTNAVYVMSEYGVLTMELDDPDIEHPSGYLLSIST